MANKLVIFLHGVGSNGADLYPIGQYWQRGLNNLEIASPNAPFKFMNSLETFEWFSIQAGTEQNRFERIEAARVSFDKCITEILKTTGFEQRTQDVVLCGFSQGTIMALDAVVSGRWNFAGVIGFSGRLSSPIANEPSRSTKITLMHGEADQVIPVDESLNAAAKLKVAGFDVQIETYAGLGHSVTELELQRGLAFLKLL